MANKPNSTAAQSEAQRIRTKANKIKRIERELQHNPNNTVAQQTLERLRLSK